MLKLRRFGLEREVSELAQETTDSPGAFTASAEAE